MNSSFRPEVFFSLLILVFTACTKIETTQLGGDLIPVVDNINTFDTVLEVNAVNDIPADSTRMFTADPHMAGAMDNDPVFGTTRASLFFELKPGIFPFIMSTDSIIGLDSAVLILSYAGYYGDSASPVRFGLYETNESIQRDTSLLPVYTLNPPLSANSGRLLGTRTMMPLQFKDSIPIKRGDSLYGKVNNQLRIPLNYAFANELFRRDTTNAFRSDSAFKTYYKGFALRCEGPANALLYFALNNPATKLEFFYRSKQTSTGKIDTTSNSLSFSAFCGHAVKMERNRSGSEMMQFMNPDPARGSAQVYVQSTPGTTVKIKIPGLKTLTNRIIHRAELRVTELSPNTGIYGQFTPPSVLYLDAADSNNTYRGIPYDLAPLTNYFCFPNVAIEYFYFGGVSKPEVFNGELLHRYYFNLTRHIQSVITRKEPSYDFRLSAPYYLDYQNCSNGNPAYPPNIFFLRKSNNTVANLPGKGRIRLAGSNHPDPQKKLQLRIIYSKI